MSTPVAVIIGITSYLLVGSIIGLIPAVLARSKGRSFSFWWAMSVLGFGILTVIPVMLLPVYRCPECREVVAPEARICWHCGTSMARPFTDTAPALEPIKAEDAGPALANIGMLAMVSVIATTGVLIAGFKALSGWGAIGLCIGIVIAMLSLTGVGVLPSIQVYRQARKVAIGRP